MRRNKNERKNIMFSDKQKLALNWWANPEYSKYDGIICHGAVRSGKTFALSVSFMIWAMTNFDGCAFALCGKTISSLRRNMSEELFKFIRRLKMTCVEKLSKNYIDVHFGARSNRFYIFGGKDEGSQSLIQGMTLAGVLFDEAALMPRSFVEQAAARCSVTGSKLWFDCNPENPYHWFKREWIDKSVQKHMLVVHFKMSDNPSLSKEVLKRYSRIYTGTFYRRYVLGEWTAAEGLVYPMFDCKKNLFSGEIQCSRYVVSCDYGTVNPSSFGLWGEHDGKWYRLAEYYYDSRKEGWQRTDEEHYDGLEKLCGERAIECVVCDPSAASFIECIRRHGKYHVKAAKNDVIWGIRLVSDALRSGKILFCDKCTDSLREFNLYRWDSGSSKDVPIKENDHAMDDIRYFVTSFIHTDNDGFCVLSVSRN